MKHIPPFAAALMCSFVAGPAISAEFSVSAALVAKPAQLWSAVMTGLYGPYDKKLKCWIGRFDGTKMCMRPHKLVAQAVNGADLLFLVVAGSESGSMGCHACSGNVGFVVLGRNGDNLVQRAANNLYEPLGSWGEAPGEESFSLVRIGPAEYGWTVEQGYTGQGVTMGSVSIYAADGPAVKSLGSIPSYYDDCGARGEDAPCDSYDLDIAFGPEGEGRYFNAVATPAPDSEKPPGAGRFVIPFDAEKGAYVAPSDLKELLNTE